MDDWSILRHALTYHLSKMRHTLATSLLAPAMLALCFVLAYGPAFAHGGGLDAAGCHHDRKRGGYHCHRAGYVRPAVPTTPSQVPRQLVPTGLATEPASRYADFPAQPELAPNSWKARDQQRREDRAGFWNEKGYTFNPQYMSAYAMDQKVRDIERARFWNERGYTFNPEYVSAFAMDRKVRDIERAKYWAARGFNFNPEYMSAYAMDREAEQTGSRGVAQK